MLLNKQAAPQQHHQQHPDQETSSESLVSQLPACVWALILRSLDPFSALQLRRASPAFKQLVCSATPDMLHSIPACQLRAANADELLAAESPSGSCLCITAARRPVALSRLNERRRCEQQLAVFLDNLGSSSSSSPASSSSSSSSCRPNLTALDISTAVSHITCTTLQLLVEALPHLHQLSLPPVATCSSAADALGALQCLPELRACDLDCRLFSSEPSSSARTAAGSSSLQGSGGQDGHKQQQQQQQHPQDWQQHQPLYQQQQQQQQQQQDYQQQEGHEQQEAALVTAWSQQHQQHPLSANSAHSSASGATHGLLSAAASAAGRVPSSMDASSSSSSSSCSAAASTSSRPWAALARLTHIQHLQLQHLQPGCLQDSLHAVARLPALCSLSVTGLCKAAATVLFTPAAAAPGPMDAAADESGRRSQWLLGSLQDLTSLTRLELGLEPCASSRSSSSTLGASSICPDSPAASLVVPAHTGSTGSQPYAAGPTALGITCAWSCLQQVQELVLHGVCLDSPLLAATALGCKQLTALCVGGLDLQQDVMAVAGVCAVGALGFSHLGALQVEQHFNLGPNSAAALMPELTRLKLTHAGSCSPNLRCLEHHQRLSSLDITAAPGSSWVMHSLQLGYLVHLPALQELRLAESNDASNDGPPAAVRGSPRQLRGGSPGCSKSSSHWLPACTGYLSQVTSLELSGPVTDHALGQLPGQFPGLRRLTVDSSYFASDGGLQKLTCSPHLQLLVLRNCKHITDWGLDVLLTAGGIRMVAVQGCAGIDERACHRIRKACRYSGSQLLWFGSGSSTASPTSHAADCGGSGAAGSLFLQRCWKQEQQQHNSGDWEAGPTATLVAAATGVWLASSSCCPAVPAAAGVAPVGVSASSSSSTRPSFMPWEGRSRAIPAAVGTFAFGHPSISPHSHGVPVVAVAATSSACPPPRPRRISGGCLPPAGAHGVRATEWKPTAWGGPGHAFAH